MLTEKLIVTELDTEASVVAWWISNLLNCNYVLETQSSHYPLSLNSILDIILQNPTRECAQPLIGQLVRLIKPEAAPRAEKFLTYIRDSTKATDESRKSKQLGKQDTLSLDQMELIVADKFKSVEDTYENNWKIISLPNNCPLGLSIDGSNPNLELPIQLDYGIGGIKYLIPALPSYSHEG